MAAPQGNQNASKKGRTRVAVCLSISDEKDRQRLSWAVARLQAKDIQEPINAQIIREVKDFCYSKIDEEMKMEKRE